MTRPPSQGTPASPSPSLMRLSESLLWKVVVLLPLHSVLEMSYVNSRLRSLLQSDTARTRLVEIGYSRGVPPPPDGYRVLSWWRMLFGRSFLCEACGRESVPLNFSILRHLCAQCTFFASRTLHTFQEVFGNTYSKFSGPVERLLYLQDGYSVFVPPQYLWDDPTKCLPSPNDDLTLLETSTDPAALRALQIRQRIPIHISWWRRSLLGRCFEVGIQASPSLWSLVEVVTRRDREEVLPDAVWASLEQPFVRAVHGTLCTAILRSDTPYSRHLSDTLVSGVSRFRKQLKPSSRLLPAPRALLGFAPLVKMLASTHEELLNPRAVSDFLYSQYQTLFGEVDRFRKQVADRFREFEGFRRAYARLSPVSLELPPEWQILHSLAIVQIVCNVCGHLSLTVAAFLNHLNSGSTLCALSGWHDTFSLSPGLAAPALVMLSELDPSTATADAMDDLSYIYRCKLCPEDSQPVQGSWREMVTHYHAFHELPAGAGPGSSPSPDCVVLPENLFTVLGHSHVQGSWRETVARYNMSRESLDGTGLGPSLPPDTSISPENLFAVLGQSPLFPNAMPLPEWTCARCHEYTSQRATRKRVEEHLASE
ncbi:hypothetical protein V5O48_008877 [Marasmius crinis-equi]|uniref:F-box domain-containing protein n=1 Tax=Marasmius crinis-equi TaxID=585013 RepID=A0ABR3FCS3_9AGAR